MQDPLCLCADAPLGSHGAVPSLLQVGDLSGIYLNMPLITELSYCFSSHDAQENLQGDSCSSRVVPLITLVMLLVNAARSTNEMLAFLFSVCALSVSTNCLQPFLANSALCVGSRLY